MSTLEMSAGAAPVRNSGGR